MAFVGAAIGIGGLGALAAAGASIYTANKNGQIQSDAANKSAELQGKALDFQKGNYDTASGNLSPFIKSGQGANDLLSGAYGLNGGGALGPSALASFMNSPDYKVALKGGSDALDNSAASKSGLLGGNQIRAQTEYGQGLATQNLQNYFARLSGMSQQGQNAGYQLGSIGTDVGKAIGTTSNNMGQNLMAAGTAQAAGNNGMLGAFNGLLAKGSSNGSSPLSLFDQMSKSSYNNSGGSSVGNPTQLNSLY